MKGRQTSMKRTGLMLACGLAACAVTASAADTTTDAFPGFTMEFVTIGNPGNQGDDTGYGAVYLLQDLLATRGHEVAGKTVTISLRKGMKWNDGEPCTADSVVYWWEDVVGNDELSPTKPSNMKHGGELAEGCAGRRTQSRRRSGQRGVADHATAGEYTGLAGFKRLPVCLNPRRRPLGTP